MNEKKEKMQTLVTDEKGEACALLDMLSSGESFFVRQTKGAEGYSFAEIFDSSKETPVEEDGHLVYTFKAKDVFEDYAFIHIKKMMVTDRPSKTETVTQPEAGARFEIRNEPGKSSGDTYDRRKRGSSKRKTCIWNIYDSSDRRSVNAQIQRRQESHPWERAKRKNGSNYYNK